MGGGEYVGPESTAPVVAWQRNGRTVLWGLSHLYFLFVGLPMRWGPTLALFPLFL